MAFTHGKNSLISIDDVSGTLFDMSKVANSVEMPIEIETAETSHFGTNAKEYIVGQNDSTVTIAGLFDAEVDAKISAVIDAIADGTIESSTVEYQPAGGPVGPTKPLFRCEVIWTSYGTTSGVGDVVSFSLEGQRTGGTERVTS